jgi:hypothetical protein
MCVYFIDSCGDNGELSAICHSPYVDDNSGNTYMVYVWYGTYFMSARSIQTAKVQGESTWRLHIPVQITPFQSC